MSKARATTGSSSRNACSLGSLSIACASGTGAAAGTDRNVVGLGPFDEVRDDQEVTRIVHAVDHVDLEGETLLILLFRGAGRQAVNLQAPCEPLPGLALQLRGLLGYRIGA